MKWLLFPGVDLHTRCRYRYLPRFFRAGPLETLDAGCGNGALAYAAYVRGNRVLGVTNSSADVQKARALFAEVGVDANRLTFEVCNLYDLETVGKKFDQIICSETLEHIRDDAKIIRTFSVLLKPGGVLHLCCPNAAHPDHNLGRVDEPEDGRHVRDGYTLETYRQLLAPHGFEIIEAVGLGGALLTSLDRLVRTVGARWGTAAALLFVALVWPLTALDRLNPKTPFSLYVQAELQPRSHPYR